MAGATLALDAADGEARGRAVVQTLAAVAESMVQQAAAAAGPHRPGLVPNVPSAPKTKFDAFRAPAISIGDYLARIHKYAACSPECFVLALVYVDRLHQLRGVALSALNAHRVLLTSVVLAAKFFDDHYFNNAYYAKVGGVPGAEMNELELEFLLLVNFSLHVTSDTFARYYNELANHGVYRSVRAAAAAAAPAADPADALVLTRHFVVPDPEQDGALVYVVKRYPRHHPPALHQQQHQQQQQQQQFMQTRGPAAAGGLYAGEDAGTGANAVGTGTNAVGIARAKSSRASGQKRRSAVALGVNA